MPKRNWKAIAAIQEYFLRVAISLTTDPATLAGFAKGFPHLFTDGEDEGHLYVPLSALKAVAYEYARNNSDRPELTAERDANFCLCNARHGHPEFDLPRAFTWGVDGDKIPPSVLEQLAPQKAQAGMTVEYMEEQYLIFEMDVPDDGEGAPKIGGVFNKSLTNMISLVSIKFVALDR